MKDLPKSVFDYLERKAINLGRELTDTEVIAFKKEHRKAYLKDYKKKYRRCHKLVSVSLTPKEYEVFKEKVKQSGKKARIYIKEALLNCYTLSRRPEYYACMLEVIDLLDEGIFEANFKRVKEALYLLNKLKNKWT